jgi:beta-fructofuranosidase
MIAAVVSTVMEHRTGDPAGEAERTRPDLHFTARQGWINDPHGVVHDGARYHLFFQYNPAGTAWGEAVHWGHATSPDLIAWTEHPPALAPEAGEIGCWSGSVVLAAEPNLFYTRIVPGDPRYGQIARAVGSDDLMSWRRSPAASVVAGPPPGVVEFRDPVVSRAGDGWRMHVGAQLAGGAGALVQYHSADLGTWAYDGIVVAGGPGMWECPQLFELDGAWVLLISVVQDGAGSHVEYGLGDYDGTRFRARVWGRFSHGDAMYATTAFLDADGRRCVMSWLRESEPVTSPWAGALSVPWVLRVDGDVLTAAPHPNIPADRITGDGRIRTIEDAGIVETVTDGVSGIGCARIIRFAASPIGQPQQHANT